MESATQDLRAWNMAAGIRSLPAPRSRAALYMGLWMLVWAAYNTGPWVVLDPSFPASTAQLINGIRAFSPMLAGWLALMLILQRGGISKLGLMGPLGLFGFYTLIGLVPSLFLSTNVYQAMYFALAFGCPLLILMLALSDDQPGRTMSRLLTLSWLVAVVMMVGIVLALPLIGGPSLLPTDGSVFHVKGGWSVDTVAFADMPGPRGTGLARYAAVAGLAALGGISQGKLAARVFWVAMVPVSVYVLLAAQGRSEILAFIIAAGVLLLVRHSSRYILLTWGFAGALLMARAGLFARLWQFGSRTGQFDPTLTGRTVTWQQGWELIGTSPLVGLGFFADRIFLQMQHIHNGLLHALIQSGILGSAAFVGAFVVAWLMVLRLYMVAGGSSAFLLHPEVPAVLLFFTLMNVTESTAQFSSNWLFLAPVMAWIQMAFWKSYAGKTAPPDAQSLGARVPAPGSHSA